MGVMFVVVFEVMFGGVFGVLIRNCVRIGVRGCVRIRVPSWFGDVCRCVRNCVRNCLGLLGRVRRCARNVLTLWSESRSVLLSGVVSTSYSDVCSKLGSVLFGDAGGHIFGVGFGVTVASRSVL